METTNTPAIGGAGVGFEPSQQSGTTANVNDTTSQQTPTPIELTDDSYVKLPGQDKPVKYGEHTRGFQSEFTKKSQELAKIREQNARNEALLQDRERRLQQMEQQSRQPQGTKPNPTADLVQAIKALPYLSGEDAARVTEHIVGQMSQFSGQLEQRDQAIVMLYNQIQQIQKGLGGLNAQSATEAFNHKIDGWVKELDLPQEATDLAKEIYLAYEGDDLDNEFPNILKNRWAQIEAAITGRQRKQVEEARNRNLRSFAPGKGGTGTPSRPLNEGYKSARQIADEMFPLLNGQET